MQRSGLSRILPIALILVVIAVAVAGLFSLGQSMFGGDTQSGIAVNEGEEALTRTENGSGVRMTVRGEIVGNGEFNSYTITIRPTYRNMTTYVGYEKQIVERRELNNNKEAYEQLVYALQRLNYMGATPFEGERNDTRGICATGLLYEFEVLRDNRSVQKLWTTSCDDSGSFDANLTRVRELFQDQIPDMYKLLRDIDLS